MSRPANVEPGNPIPRMRVDKWLWAARFFKTRSIATTAVETGKVELNGERCKPAKLIAPGDLLRVRNEAGDFTLAVLALLEQRGPATVAATLYQETEQSRLRREQIRADEAGSGPYVKGRPTKRARRQMDKLTRTPGA